MTVLAHLVLYEFKDALATEGRQQLHDALQGALSAIPTIRTARFGRRLMLGASYEASMTEGYSYFALFEFDDADGLRRYLEHPAHEALGRAFWACAARTLVFDFELGPGDGAAALRAWT